MLGGTERSRSPWMISIGRSMGPGSRSACPPRSLLDHVHADTRCHVEAAAWRRQFEDGFRERGVPERREGERAGNRYKDDKDGGP